MAVFSLSTMATGASGCNGKRWQPKKHCCRFASGFPNICLPIKAMNVWPSLFTRLPVAGLNCITLHCLGRPCSSICQKAVAPGQWDAVPTLYFSKSNVAASLPIIRAKNCHKLFCSKLRPLASTKPAGKKSMGRGTALMAGAVNLYSCCRSLSCGCTLK